MSIYLKERARECYERLKDCRDRDEIIAVAKAEGEYLRQRFSAKSLATQLSKHGYYKLFKSIPLEDGVNACQVQKKDGSTILKHLFLEYCGLTSEEWAERNESTLVLSRLDKQIELDPHLIYEPMVRLIHSDDRWEVAAGLIMATGRRPSEIVARGSFTVHGTHHVMFSGQLKKRGKKPVYPIATLLPSEDIVSALKRLRRFPEFIFLLRQVKEETKDVTDADWREIEQNKLIDSRTNNKINGIISQEFTSIVPPKDDKFSDSCDDLRPAYAALATKRDRGNESVGQQMLYAARLLGHFTEEEPTDADLKQVISTIRYLNYKVKGEVPFFAMPGKVKARDLPRISCSVETHDQIKQWAELWGCTQHEVVEKMKEAMIENLSQGSLATQSSLESDERIEKLENQVAKMMEMVERLASQFTKEASPTEDPPVDDKQGVELQPPAPPKAKQPKIDWTGVSKSELFGDGDAKKPVRGTGAAEERIRRSVAAIMRWNDRYPANESYADKWAIGNLSIRELSGVNGQTVTRWLEDPQNAEWVEQHNRKHNFSAFHNRKWKASADIKAECWDSIE